MTDNEIIKALECCVASPQMCRQDCPLLLDAGCSRVLRRNTLDLIQRQRAEMEQLHESSVNRDVLVDKLITLAGGNDFYKFTLERVVDIINELRCCRKSLMN